MAIALVASFGNGLESPFSNDGPAAISRDDRGFADENDEEAFGPDGKEEIAIETDEDDTPRWRTNLFTLYARVFQVMLAKWKERLRQAHEDEKAKELDDLILPSNEEWRYRVYYRLVDMQREIDSGIAENSLGYAS